MNKHTPIAGRSVFLTIAAAFGSVVASGQENPTEDVYTLSPFEVSTAGGTAYGARSSISASTFELPLTQIPVTMSIATEALLEDLGTQDVNDFTNAVSGMSIAGVGNSQNFAIRMRGFEVPSLIDGFAVAKKYDFYFFDRVEAAKGASAVLYGSGTTGGVINQITKKPLQSPSATISASMGTRNYYDAKVDFTGPIDEAGNFSYRFVAHHNQRETDIQWDQRNSDSYLGALQGRFLDQKVILDLSYMNYNVGDSSQHGATTDPQNDPRGRFEGMPSFRVTDKYGLGYETGRSPDQFQDQDNQGIKAEATVFINDTFTLRTGYFESDTESAGFNFGFDWLQRAEQLYLGEVQTKTARNNDIRYLSTNEKFYRADLLSRFDVGETHHNLVTTYRRDQGSFRDLQYRLRQTIVDNPVGPFQTTPLDTEFTQEEFDTMLSTNPRRDNGNAMTDWNEQITVTDHIAMMNDRLNFLAGVSYIDAAGLPNDLAYQASTIFEPVADSGHHFFVNFSTDFVPTNFIDREGEFRETQIEGEGIDLGWRFELMEGRLNGSVALFDMERSNMPRRTTVLDDPSTPEDEAESYFSLSGLEESKGVEWAIDYAISDNWNLTFNGMSSSPKVVLNPQDPGSEGFAPEDTIDDMFNVATRYSFIDGKLAGLMLGMSGSWRNDGHDNSASQNFGRKTADHHLVNLFCAYSFKLNETDATVRLDLKNALDKEGYLVRQSQFGDPRYLYLTTKFKF